MKSLFIASLFALASADADIDVPIFDPITNKNYTFDYLASSRRFDNVLPFTAEQRQVAASTFQNMMKIYVNRESKIKNYNYDPIGRIDEIAAKAPSMSNLEFANEMSAAYSKMRDFHTNYYYPGVHACTAALRAVTLRQIFARDSPLEPLGRKVIVSGYTRWQPVKDFTPDLKKVSIGDEVIAIDGKPILDYLTSTIDKFGGANIGPGLTYALNGLFAVSGTFNELPKEDAAVFTMKSASTGQTYELNAPWVLRRDDACVKYNNAVNVALNGTAVPPASPSLTNTEVTINAPAPEPKQIIKLEAVNPMVDFILENTDVKPEIAAVPLTPTIETDILFGIYAPKNLGVIRLASFSPKKVTSDIAISIIRNLLLNELKDTDSIVFDIRANGGGSILFANGLPQLFVPQFDSQAAKAINHPYNVALFNKTGDAKWFNASIAAKPTDVYTPLVRFTEIPQDNTLGMVYTKPVGILTDNACYSACSLFSSSMQDIGAATIYGEDLTTGGGGANVVELVSYYNRNLPNVFRMPINVTRLYPNGEAGIPNARLGWRLLVRKGKNAGKTTEDDNVASDKIVPIPRSEIADPTTNVQMDRIGEDLRRKAKVFGKTGYVTIKQPLLSDSPKGASVFDVASRGISKFVVQDQAGSEITVVNVKLSQVGKGSNTTLAVSSDASAFGVYQFNIFGYDLSGAVAFRTSRSLRVVPAAGDYAKVSGAFNVDILGSPAYAAQYDYSKPGKGWTKTATSLVIGDNVKYEDLVKTEINYFLSVSAPTKITIVANYDTEPDFDYFYFGFVKDGKVTQFLTTYNPIKKVNIDGVSGVGQINQAFDLPTGDSYVFVKFVSDEGVVSRGVEVKSISIA